ncbi:hypothetical protein Tco_0091778 [Tanacetum coccineum]
MEDTLSKFKSESTKRHEENSNLIKEIRASTDAAIRNQGASIKTLEIQIGQMSKVLQEREFGSLPSSTEANPRDQVKSISTTIKVDSYPIRHRTVKYRKGIAENMLVELNDLNVPLEIRRYQVHDLMPTIEEGEVIEEFRTRDDELDAGIDDYPNYCDYDKKIHINCSHNLKFCSFRKHDAYRDEGMGDVIFGESFLREVGIKTKRFEGMITIYNGDNEVSKEDKKNGILHPYQKLIGFYKGVLNLGPD